jgi:hypothetical protein
MLFQQLVNRMCSHCLFPACWQLATRLLSSTTVNKGSTDLLKVVPTTCYRPAIQQVVSENLVATRWNNRLLQHADKVCCKHILLTSCEIFTFVPGKYKHWVLLVFSCISLVTGKQAIYLKATECKSYNNTSKCYTWTAARHLLANNIPPVGSSKPWWPEGKFSLYFSFNSLLLTASVLMPFDAKLSLTWLIEV